MLILDGATDALRIGGIVLNAYPWSVCAWINPPNVAQSRTFAGFSQQGSDVNFAVAEQNAAAGRGFYRLAGVDAIPSKAASLTANVWNSVVNSAASAVLKSVWVGGGVAATDATNTPTVNLDCFLIGARERSGGPENFWAGSIAAVSIHNVALVQADAAGHAAGVDPRSLPGCTHFFRLESNSADEVGGWVMVDVGTPTYSSADHPPISYAPDDRPWALWRSVGRSPAYKPYNNRRQRRRRQRGSV